MSKSQKTVRINGKEYPVKYVEGEFFIDGKTIDEFINSLDEETIMMLGRIGEQAVKDASKGKISPYQKIINELHSMKNN